LIALISSKRKAKDFFLGTALASEGAFFAVLPLQLLYNQPCCGCFCDKSDTTI
jgi:hypothetical protein